MREEVAGTTALLGPLLEGVLEDRLEGEGAVGVRGWMDSKLLIINDLFSIIYFSSLFLCTYV